MVYEFEVDAENAGVRIDNFLNKYIEDLSRSYIQHLIKDGFVKVNEKNIKPNYKCKSKDIINVQAEEKKELFFISFYYNLSKISILLHYYLFFSCHISKCK